MPWLCVQCVRLSPLYVPFLKPRFVVSLSSIPLGWLLLLRLLLLPLGWLLRWPLLLLLLKWSVLLALRFKIWDVMLTSSEGWGLVAFCTTTLAKDSYHRIHHGLAEECCPVVRQLLPLLFSCL